MKVIRIKRILGAAVATAVAWGVAAPAALAQSNSLAMKMAHELGVTATHYKYTEPGLASIKGMKIGFDYSGTYVIGSQWPNRNDGWFVRGDLRYATGKVDYSSGISGSIDNLKDWYYEVRGLIGKEFDQGSYVLAPYVGVGFRHLENDLRGVSTTGARGYRRESNYTTLPIGVLHKMKLSNHSQLHTTVEYSHLLRGQQESKLSDVGPAFTDVSLRQRSGYGLRLGAMVKFDTWSVGPMLSVWRIKASEIGGTPPVLEPKNNTVEFGIKASYHF
jgi:hypothetical protein